MSPSTDVRFRLAALLRAARLSQRELAALARVSVTTVNRIARNRTRQISLDTLEALSRVLKVPPGALFERYRKRPRPDDPPAP